MRVLINNMEFIKINYFNRVTDLCVIADKHDTDKSAIRQEGHSHPYSIFYYDLFKGRRKDKLKIGEIGILDGGSLCMWNDFFPSASIVGFDSNPRYLNKALKTLSDRPQIEVDYIDIGKKDVLDEVLEKHGPFDILIEDSTHLFDHQILFIKTAVDKLKPGGTMIVEDIFITMDHRTGMVHSIDEYMKRLDDKLIQRFERCYLIHLDHSNRRSPGWDNDALLVFDGYRPCDGPRDGPRDGLGEDATAPRVRTSEFSDP
jgi:predicted O-methyltransferase YrrM